MTFGNKVALVTGSTKGIGQAIAVGLARSGAKVVITSRKLEGAERLADSLRSQGLNAVGAQFDLAATKNPAELVDFTTNHFGRLDILVNNAITQDAALPMGAVSDCQINSIFQANITNTLLLCKSAYPYLKANEGNIINISSVVTNRYMLGLPLYAIIKGAITQMTKVLAAEWGKDKVRVNAINPGCVRTSVYENLGLSGEVAETNFKYVEQFHPLGRIGESEEIANMANFLASDKAQFVTGGIFDVDGGYTIQGIDINPENAP